VKISIIIENITSGSVTGISIPRSTLELPPENYALDIIETVCIISGAAGWVSGGGSLSDPDFWQAVREEC
jgi:hypothetical protein